MIIRNLQLSIILIARSKFTWKYLRRLMHKHDQFRCKKIVFFQLFSFSHVLSCHVILSISIRSSCFSTKISGRCKSLHRQTDERNSRKNKQPNTETNKHRNKKKIIINVLNVVKKSVTSQEPWL